MGILASMHYICFVVRRRIRVSDGGVSKERMNLGGWRVIMCVGGDTGLSQVEDVYCIIRGMDPGLLRLEEERTSVRHSFLTEFERGKGLPDTGTVTGAQRRKNPRREIQTTHRYRSRRRKGS